MNGFGTDVLLLTLLGDKTLFDWMVLIDLFERLSVFRDASSQRLSVFRDASSQDVTWGSNSPH